MLYVLRQYPQVTESYMETEIRVLEERGHEVEVIALNPATDPRRNTHSFRYIPQSDEEAIARAVRELEPDIVHGHELDNSRRAFEAARAADVQFTLRTHSYDVIGLPEERMRQLARHLADDRCAGVLAFPWAVERLVGVGVPADKIRACWPVVDYDRFHDESPNGDRVMNLGAAQPKKGMDDYIRLAAGVPGRGFDLYAVGFGIERLRDLNYDQGKPVTFMPRLEHDQMPAEYKRHEWLVYTAAERTVGWPVAVAEAQASGVGVCMQNVRPDVAEYVGDCGFVFDTVDEIAGLISGEFPSELRRRGFEHARRSDARSHIATLEEMWDGAGAGVAPEPLKAAAAPSA